MRRWQLAELGGQRTFATEVLLSQGPRMPSHGAEAYRIRVQGVGCPGNSKGPPVSGNGNSSLTDDGGGNGTSHP